MVCACFIRLVRSLCCTVTLPFLLAGCGHTPVTQTLAEAFGTSKSVSDLALNSKLQYLKVTTSSSEALMVLGYTNDHPLGPIQTWYSNLGELLQLQNGRLLSTKGLRTDWSSVQYEGLPAAGWLGVVNQAPIRFTRIRDEMPGFRFGIKETLTLRLIAAPSDAHLKSVQPSTLQWFEERVEGQDRPSARYGVSVKNRQAILVYGEQCLTESLCLAWQVWPPTQP